MRRAIKKIQTGIRLPVDLYDRVKVAAAKASAEEGQFVSVSEFVTRAIRWYLSYLKGSTK